MHQLSFLPLEVPSPLPQTEISNERCTLRFVVDLARQVLGAIDLDSTTCDVTQQTVRAKQFYTVSDDGLSQPWSGRVWLNSPYSMPLIAQFTQRLVREYQAGNTTAALCLVNAATDTRWLHNLARTCARRFDFKGRIHFNNPYKPGKSNCNGQVIFYFDSAPERFEMHFGPQGLMYECPLNSKEEVEL